MVFVRGIYSVTPEEEFPVDPVILHIRRYQAGIDRLNAPPQPATPEVEAMPDAPVVKLTKTKRAIEWLRLVTERGPVAQAEIVERGRKEGFSLKVLKAAKKRAGVVSTRKGRADWAWRRAIIKTTDKRDKE